MKASAFPVHIHCGGGRFVVKPRNEIGQLNEEMYVKATMLERYLALADEVRQEREKVVLDSSCNGALKWVEERLRAIAEGREET